MSAICCVGLVVGCSVAGVVFPFIDCKGYQEMFLLLVSVLLILTLVVGLVCTSSTIDTSSTAFVLALFPYSRGLVPIKLALYCYMRKNGVLAKKHIPQQTRPEVEYSLDCTWLR